MIMNNKLKGTFLEAIMIHFKAIYLNYVTATEETGKNHAPEF